MTHRVAIALFVITGCSDGTNIDNTGSTDSRTDTQTGTDSGTTKPTNPYGEGPAAVNLGVTTDGGAPGSYVILAETAITNVTGSSITGGDLGLSPAAASFITGFSLVADPTDVFSTSVSVTPPGRIYAADYADPTPTNLTAAVLGMQAAYTDAAGRSLPDHLDLNSGDLGGATLSPGLYTWGSTVTVPSDVTLAGGAEDVWIFQIANDLDVSAATRVVLSGGADARNIFWQVAGQATIHTNAHFEGVILSKTAVTLQTGASFHGRVYAQSMVALDDNTVTAP
ncbi:MAG: ice-binding family protein [Myxococcota bacterium]